ncbi:lysophospholipid acyltransferase family protein [Teredinibacter sp. KSP-S5-2]|uniref:lysophospholipid acyltransferase family protein n=1 Tax=Teredinibacter sp. KSP-S5-2 TaxID=3034506 RepID=UPI0029349A04|nr:lysophospholipid acyltransferase family protein [Teredinibacter sp. KSP-S5-2]WNO09238.1 lysophospholipid acyltransferase family protein [Teredinibacter sp. KSP-S5-2]
MSRIVVRLKHYNRVLATGLCFATFFLCGFAISTTLFPVFYLWPGTRLQKSRRARQAIHYTFRWFVGQMEFFGLIKVRTHNAGLLKQAKGCLVIANHPTLIDVVILASLVPYPNCVVKGELFRNKYLKRVVTLAGFISNDDADMMINGAQQAFEDQDALIIFPEGSRSVPKQPLQFRRGAANIAVRTRAPMLSVFITCNPITLIKGEAWYQVPPSKAVIDIYVREWLDPIDMADGCEDPPAAARKLTKNLQEYFEKGLQEYV